MKKKFGNFFSSIFLLAYSQAFAAAYSLPASTDSLIGNLQFLNTTSDERVVDIQKRYDIGFNALENANPHLNLANDLPAGVALVIPTQHILPSQTRTGVVINLPEMRMYYYPSDSSEVLTYPIGIGKVGKTIPITNTAVTRKVKNPQWVPPKDIREFNMKQGIVLPRVMPAGPDNPLGHYAIYMRVPTYLIHSTPYVESVGKRASFGCIRMFPSDIEDFFPSIEGGIPIAIINSPTKVGWHNNSLYLEAYEPLVEHSKEANASLAGMVNLIHAATKDRPTLVNWQQVSYIAKERDGIPHEIGMRITHQE